MQTRAASSKEQGDSMLKLGLTGGIASGKSVVAAILRELGFPVLDADSISHKLLEPGQPAHEEILQSLGPGLADSSGRIDRHKLADIVFADPAKLAQLNAILHPRVDQIIFQQLEQWQENGTHLAAFVEAALLIEAGMAPKLDGLVVAWCTQKQQLERLRARGMSETEARRRIAAQLPIEEKLKQATYSVDCSGTLEQTRDQVQAFAAKLHKGQAG
ncbi:MAG TPA: dephospho-CoA kinase [Candidatus Limnocylindrales bacterium]|nr:dephospho-CoA kinase [Candidatus Limnocylindrales bacterium]